MILFENELGVETLNSKNENLYFDIPYQYKIGIRIQYPEGQQKTGVVPPHLENGKKKRFSVSQKLSQKGTLLLTEYTFRMSL